MVGLVVAFALCVCSGLYPLLTDVYAHFSVMRIVWDLSYPRYANEQLLVNELATYTQANSALAGVWACLCVCVRICMRARVSDFALYIHAGRRELCYTRSL